VDFILPISPTLSVSRPTEVPGHARTLALPRLATVHTSGVVIADRFPYVSGFYRVRRATNSSFPTLRMTHFDKRSAISVARTCLHLKQPGMFPVAPKTTKRWDTYRQLGLRYQHGVCEGRAAAEVWNGGGVMQTRKDGVRICHAKDRKVMSTPWRNVLDH
jgi:hypothetical protein